MEDKALIASKALIGLAVTKTRYAAAVALLFGAYPHYPRPLLVAVCNRVGRRYFQDWYEVV
jgi:hypothetical protein